MNATSHDRRPTAHRPGALHLLTPHGLIWICLLLALTLGCSQDPLQRVSELIQQGKDTEAIEILEQLVDRDPKNPELQYAYGWALHRIGRPDRAQWPLRAALDDPKQRIPASRLLAEGAMFMQDWDGVFEATDRILEENPDDLQALLTKARAQVQSRQLYEEALATADRILELAPDDTRVLPIRAAALLGLERLDEVAEALATLDMRVRDVDLGEDGAAHACATQGTFAAERQEFEEARKIFLDCLAEFPASPMVVTAAVDFFENINDPNTAIEVLEKHIEEAPASSLKIALASRLASRGRIDDAEALLRQDTESEDPRVQREAWLDLTKHFQRLERWKDAADCAEKAFAAAPEVDDSIRLEVADAATLAGRYDRALEVANQIEAPAYREMIRGRVAIERKEFAMALEHLEAGLKLWPNNAIARYYAALAAEGVNDWDRAIEEYRWSIRSGAGSTNARARLGLLYEARQQPVAAWEVVRTNLRDAPPDRELSLVASRLVGLLGQMQNPATATVMRGLRTPQDLAEASARIADGLATTREGSGLALNSILSNRSLTLNDPAYVPALQKAAELLIKADKAQEARDLVQKALTARPDAASFHALWGHVLATTGGSPTEVRTAIEHAHELDANDLTALLALGELENGAGNHQKALELFEHALERDKDNPEAQRGAATALYALGQPERADELLEQRLEETPFDVAAASAIATQQLERGAVNERTRLMAERAVEFGGGAEAEALLERVAAALGDAKATSGSAAG